MFPEISRKLRFSETVNMSDISEQNSSVASFVLSLCRFSHLYSSFAQFCTVLCACLSYKLKGMISKDFREFHSNGWMTGTGGALCIRTGHQVISIYFHHNYDIFLYDTVQWYLWYIWYKYSSLFIPYDTIHMFLYRTFHVWWLRYFFIFHNIPWGSQVIVTPSGVLKERLQEKDLVGLHLDWHWNREIFVGFTLRLAQEWVPLTYQVTIFCSSLFFGPKLFKPVALILDYRIF